MKNFIKMTIYLRLAANSTPEQPQFLPLLATHDSRQFMGEKISSVLREVSSAKLA
jgi:hypothetical protein